MKYPILGMCPNCEQGWGKKTGKSAPSKKGWCRIHLRVDERRCVGFPAVDEILESHWPISPRRFDRLHSKEMSRPMTRGPCFSIPNPLAWLLRGRAWSSPRMHPMGRKPSAATHLRGAASWPRSCSVAHVCRRCGRARENPFWRTSAALSSACMFISIPTCGTA